MKFMSLLMAMAVSMLPVGALGADLVIYDGDLETAKKVMSLNKDVTNGRDYREFSEFTYPGSGSLWIAGGQNIRECSAGAELTSEDLEKKLYEVGFAIDQLDDDLAERIFAEVDLVLPCVRDTVLPEQIARLFFLKGVLADYVGADAGLVEQAFREALGVYNMPWNQDYSPTTGMKYYKVKDEVDLWRDPDSDVPVDVIYRFQFDDLTIDGRREVETILPGTHHLQWSVEGKWRGRTFTVPREGVDQVVLASEDAWVEAVLAGPAEDSPGSMGIASAFFAPMPDVESITVISLNREPWIGYVYYPGSLDPVRKLDVRVELLNGNRTRKPKKTAKKVLPNVGVFGTYAMLHTTSYGGMEVIVHLNPIKGFEVGVGGSFLFTQYKEGSYLLPGVVLGARYMFTTKSLIRPILGVYVPVEIQEPVIVHVRGCGGMAIDTPKVSPTILVCGGVGSPGTGRFQLLVGGTFR